MSDVCPKCKRPVIHVPAYGSMTVACDPEPIKIMTNGLDGWTSVEGHRPHFETCTAADGPDDDDARADLGYTRRD